MLQCEVFESHKTDISKIDWAMIGHSTNSWCGSSEGPPDVLRMRTRCEVIDAPILKVSKMVRFLIGYLRDGSGGSWKSVPVEIA